MTEAPAFLETSRLRPRALEESDLSDLERLANDWEVARWLGRLPHPYTAGDARKFFEGQAESRETHYAITLRNEAFLGMIGHDPRPGSDKATIGYWLGRDHWGRGYATEAARAIVADAFARRMMETLWVTHAVGNEASRRVIEKLGFVPAGNAREFSLAQGREVEICCYRLPRLAWAEVLGQ